jgi:outer membrane protein TolC
LLQAQKTFLDAELSRVDAQKRRWQAAAGLAGLLQEDVFP